MIFLALTPRLAAAVRDLLVLIFACLYHLQV